jgi:outer membrane protein assembly factor BamA
MGNRHARLLARSTCTFALLAASPGLAFADEAPAELAPGEKPSVDAPPLAPAIAVAADEAAYPPPAPEFAHDRPPMSKDDWLKKPEGAYYTGLPLVNSDPDTGFGYGVRAFRFDNGERKNALFPYRAYDTRIFGQFFQTTNGLRYHWLSFDAPFFNDGPHRLKIDLTYDQNTAANWFGGGNTAFQPLQDPVTGERFDQMGDYLDSSRQVRNGTTYAFYNKFEIIRPSVSGTWEELFLGGRLRAVGGLMLQHVTIRDAEGTTVKGLAGTDEVDARQGSTLLGEQCARGQLVGCGGGFNNTIKLALSYDMRDFEPDPNSGFVLEGSTQVAGTATGSADNYAKGTVQARGYWSPFPNAADLVLAGRVLYAAQGGDVPFYSLSQITLADGEIEGLGGRTTLRGFKQNRFVGRAAALANAELRYTFVDFRTVGQRFGLMIVPFVDAGRTYARIRDTNLSDLRVSFGAGFRIAWNQATIINVDYGKSTEGAGLYINFGHPF